MDFYPFFSSRFWNQILCQISSWWD